MSEQDQTTETKSGVGLGSMAVGGVAGGLVGKRVYDAQAEKLINEAKGSAPIAKEGETAVKDAVKPELRTAVNTATDSVVGGPRQQKTINHLKDPEKLKTLDSVTFTKAGDKGYTVDFKNAEGEGAKLTGVKNIPKEAEELLKGDAKSAVLSGDKLKPLVEGKKSWVAKTTKETEKVLNNEIRASEIFKKAGGTFKNMGWVLKELSQLLELARL